MDNISKLNVGVQCLNDWFFFFFFFLIVIEILNDCENV